MKLTTVQLPIQYAQLPVSMAVFGYATPSSPPQDTLHLGQSDGTVLKQAKNVSVRQLQGIQAVVLREMAKSQPRQIGEGFMGGSSVIQLDPVPGLPPLVAKIPNMPGKASRMSNEAELLEASSSKSPRFIALIQLPDGRPALVMSHVAGETPQIEDHPYTLPQLKSLMSAVFKLDKMNIVFPELHGGNILTEGRQGSVIDYEHAYRSLKSKSPQDLLKQLEANSSLNAPIHISPEVVPFSNEPYFRARAMFEFYFFLAMADLTDTLPFRVPKAGHSVTPELMRQAFTDYLRATSGLHRKRAWMFLKQLMRPSSREYRQYLTQSTIFEGAQAQVLKNPSDDAINLEAMLGQAQFARETARHSKQIYASLPGYLAWQKASLDWAKRYYQQVQILKYPHRQSSVWKDYLTYHEKVAEDSIQSSSRNLYQTFQDLITRGLLPVQVMPTDIESINWQLVRAINWNEIQTEGFDARQADRFIPVEPYDLASMIIEAK